MIALGTTLDEFPDTKYREECMFLILKSNFKLALNSISSKKAQRIKDTMDSYVKFVDSFPESSKLKEAEVIYENILKEKSDNENS